MKRYILSEHLKTRRTTLRKMMIFIPILCTLVGYGFSAMGGPQVVNWTLLTMMNQWALLWMPALIALLVGINHNLEERSTEYKTIFSFSINLQTSWFSKNAVLAFYSLFSTLLLGLFITLLGLTGAFDTELASFTNIILALFLCWLLTLWQIPFYLWLVRKVNFFILMIVNCILGIGLGAVTAPEKWWWANPWGWSLRLEASLLKLHPNGIPLVENSPLLDRSVLPIGIILSLMLLGVILYLTSQSFKRREVL